MFCNECNHCPKLIQELKDLRNDVKWLKEMLVDLNGFRRADELPQGKNVY